MTTKDKVIAASDALMVALAEAGMPPALLIVLLPDTAQFVRVACGLDDDRTQRAFSRTIQELFLIRAAQAVSDAMPAETGPCPVCFGMGVNQVPDIPGSEPQPCPHCNATGRVQT